MGWVGFGIAAYVLMQLGIGYWVSKRVDSEESYLLAGRNLGFVLTLFAAFATWFGAETCIGAAHKAFTEGLGGTKADPFGYSACLLLMGAVFAVRLWQKRITTLADLFRNRYGKQIERLVVFILVPASLLWAAAQIRAFGQVLALSTDLDLTAAITVAAAVVLIYTVMGGMLADAITDLVQGSILIVGLFALGTFMLLNDSAAFSAITSEQLQLFSWGDSIGGTLNDWAVPIFGSVVAAELVARVMSARSERIAKRAVVSAGVLYLAIGLVPVAIGLASVHSTALPADNPEQVLMAQALKHFPAWLYVVFAGALVSAILSTVDTALLVSGSLLAHNIILPMRPNTLERGRLFVNRACVAFFGIIAYTLSLSAQSIYELVETASAVGTAGVFVCVVFALFSNFGGAWAAGASLVLGFATYLWGSLVGRDDAFLASGAVALVAFVVGGLWDRHQEGRGGTQGSGQPNASAIS